MIKKFDYTTPGRNGNYGTNDDAPAESVDQQVLEQVQQVHKLSTLSTFWVDATSSIKDACMTPSPCYC